MPSEFELITRFFSRPVPGDMLGAGDDCALFTVKPGMQLATSTDLLLEGRHFFSVIAESLRGVNHPDTLALSNLEQLGRY